MYRICAMLTLLALAPAARGGDAASDAASDEGRHRAAAELSREVLSPETWAKTVEGISRQTSERIVQAATQGGAKVDSGFASAFDQEFSKMLAYDEVVDMQAGLLARYYTEPEIRQLLAFYRTPLGLKMIRAMPEIARDVSAWTFSVMQQRMARVMERLQSQIHPPRASTRPAEAP